MLKYQMRRLEMAEKLRRWMQRFDRQTVEKFYNNLFEKEEDENNLSFRKSSKKNVN